MAGAHNTHWKVQILKVQFVKPEGARPFRKIQYMCVKIILKLMFE